MVSGVTKTPSAPMRSPPDDSPKLRHEIFMQRHSRLKPVIRGFLLPPPVRRSNGIPMEPWREKVGCHAPLKNRVTGRFVR